MYMLQVRSVPVTTRGIELAELAVKDVKKVSLRPTFEASMRLDAIASAGFSTSRSKIVNMIKAGDIRFAMSCLTCAVHRGHTSGQTGIQCLDSASNSSTSMAYTVRSPVQTPQPYQSVSATV